jgi:adenylate cyclase, class 2
MLYPAELRARIDHHYSEVMKNPVETEVKIRVPNADSVRSKLSQLGFAVSEPRVFEANTLYDRDNELRNKNEILRLREAGGHHVVTFKGTDQGGAYKNREEVETTLGSVEALGTILERLGFRRAFRYEKFRTEFERPGKEGVVTLDETPIGFFIELEGPGEWIDRTASELGFAQSDYVLDSYGKLYLADCARRGVEPADMVFSS